MHAKDERSGADHADGGDALHWIERQRIQRCCASVARRNHRDGVAVGRRTRGDFRADSAARAGAVVDDELLAEFFSQMRRYQPRDNVRAAAGGEGHDHAHGALGPLCAFGALGAFPGVTLRGGFLRQKSEHQQQTGGPVFHRIAFFEQVRGLSETAFRTA